MESPGKARPRFAGHDGSRRGGGALPLEAQRLGLEAHASDLNPVAVLINKAMIEIPPKFAGQSPVNPVSREERNLIEREWKGAQGLAEDVRYYGQWMRDEAKRRIGHLYPQVEITEEMVRERPDLERYKGRKLTVIAWLWARTVRSPNPAFADVEVPLAATFMLSTKKGKEAYVEPVIEERGYRFVVKVGTPEDAEAAKAGTKAGGSGKPFLCLMSGTPMPFEYLRSEAKSGRMGARLMAIVAEGDRGRVYLTPTSKHEAVAEEAEPKWTPDTNLPERALGFRVQEYGMIMWRDLFTPRQLAALTTFSDLVAEAMERVGRDAANADLPKDGRPLRDGGTGATAYAETVGMFLALAVSKETGFLVTQSRWRTNESKSAPAFGRQAIPMVWDYADVNPFAGAGGDFLGVIKGIKNTLLNLPPPIAGHSAQADAANQEISQDKLVSTDPPYYNNIGYADLSDFFYVWLRHSLRPIFPDLFATMAVPKTEELVATLYRHGSKDAAETFFLEGMCKAMHCLAEQTHPTFPTTIYYAFKQSETKGDTGTASTGWETFLDAVIRAGLGISGTWPMRTENATRLVGMDSNALTSSIVLVCRQRPANAPVATRREFVAALRAELPTALTHLQSGNIAPVDLAQASLSEQTFSWKPSATQVGTYEITFTVEDGRGGSDSQSVTINVEANQIPELASIGPHTAEEGSALTIILEGSDADGDALTYAVERPPTGAVLSEQTFRWTPSYSQSGEYEITFTVEDGRGGIDRETVTITVGDINRAPELATIGDQTVDEASVLTITLADSDADGDALTLAVEGQPEGSSLSGRTFRWTPTYSQAGEYEVTFTVEDGRGGIDRETITITVRNTNREPELATIGDQTVVEGHTLTLTLAGSDADGDDLIYTVEDNPPGSSLSGATFTWQPSDTQEGMYQVTFRVEDEHGGQAVETIEIIVQSRLRRLTNHNATDGGPSWSPDGTQIAFHSHRDGNSKIYVMDAADGSNPRPLIFERRGDEFPSWSPDGTQIAFDSQRGEIYVMDAATAVTRVSLAIEVTGSLLGLLTAPRSPSTSTPSSTGIGRFT